MSIGLSDQWLSCGAGYGRNLQVSAYSALCKSKLLVFNYLHIKLDSRPRIFIDFRLNRL